MNAIDDIKNEIHCVEINIDDLKATVSILSRERDGVYRQIDELQEAFASFDSLFCDIRQLTNDIYDRIEDIYYVIAELEDGESDED